jgi:hypothetical protein
MDDSQSNIPDDELKLGSFEIPAEFMSLVKISQKCDHLVSHSSSFLKNDVMVSILRLSLEKGVSQ